MKKILLIGQLTDLSGYGSAARCYMNNLIELEKEGLISLSVLNHSFEGKVSISDEERREIEKRSLTKDIEYISGYIKDPKDIKSVQEYIANKDYDVVFCHTSDLLTFGKLNGSCIFQLPHISNPKLIFDRLNMYQICSYAEAVHQCIVWETEDVPKSWQRSILDKEINVKNLLCACDWNNKTFSRLGIKTVTIPYSIDFELGHDEEYYQKIIKQTKDCFVFSSVFQWGPRKGGDILLKAFLTEFATDEKACLILKTYLSKAMLGAEQNEVEYLKKSIDQIKGNLFHYGHNFVPKCKIVIINDLLGKKQLNSIYKASDAFVLPSRGEGFCLPAVEALNYQKPVIMPDKGGHMGFISKESPYLIDSKMEYCESTRDKFWSSIESIWVEPSAKSLREKMRLAFLDKQNTKQIGIEQEQYMRNFLNKDKCVNLFKENIL